MDEKLKKKMYERRFRRAFAESVLDEALALQIRTIREKRQMSQQALAKITRMTQTAISRIESADYGRWSISTLKRLARALDLPLSVRFQSWEELMHDAENFTPAALSVPSFAKDRVFFSGEPVMSAQTYVNPLPPKPVSTTAPFVPHAGFGTSTVEVSP